MAGKLPNKYVCIDVECVANGIRHDDRTVALVAIVDQDDNVLLHKKVKPNGVIKSYLTPLTGLRSGDLDDGEDLEYVLAAVKGVLSSDTVLVGQGVKSDIAWLKLRQGTDFNSFIDIAEVFKAYNTKYRNYNYFSLSHEANILLRPGFISDEHSPVTDAKASIQLFKTYYANERLLEDARRKLIRNRPPPSWAKRNDYRWEGVCMAAYMPSKCFCGAPTKK